MDAEQTINYIKKRLPSRETLENLRAVAMLSDDYTPGEGLDAVVENLYDIRQAVHGGRRDINSSRHWPKEMDTQ